MTPLAWLLGILSVYCLGLGVAGWLMERWESRGGVGCDLDDDCADCRDVRREQI